MRRWLRIGISVCAMVVLIIVIHGVRLVSPSSIETAISQNLGPTSDVASVRRFMDTYHILYLGQDDPFRAVYGVIHGSSYGLMNGTIRVRFDFNEHGKLVSHKVSEGFEFFWAR
jgi:hypothetical protein